MKEKVVIIGVNKDGRSFASCLTYKDDEQLERDVYGKFDCNDFLVFYEENMDELDEALDDFYNATYPAILCMEDEKCIRNMVKSKEYTKPEVAKHYGVSELAVRRICNVK